MYVTIEFKTKKKLIKLEWEKSINENWKMCEQARKLESSMFSLHRF